VELSGGQREQWPQTTVAVNTQGLVVFAAVGQSPLAGRTLLAVDVGLDAAAVARLHVRDTRADGHHLDPQLMPRNPRIAEEGHLAEIAAVVGATDAHRMHADDHLAGRRRFGFGCLDESKRPGFFQQQGLHATHSMVSRP
jgi:hypothetical protein